MTSDKKTVEWTVVECTAPSLMLDDFPNLLGPLGSKVKNLTQMKVLQDFKFDGSDDEFLRCFMHLWPDDINTDFEKVRQKISKLTTPISLFEAIARS